MKNLKISKTNILPKISFDYGKGLLEIEGSSTPTKNMKFYTKLVDWITRYIDEPQAKTTFNFKLNFFNSHTKRYILKIVKIFQGLDKKKYSLTINWYYPKDDEDHKEMGEIIVESLKLKVNMIEMDNGK